MPSVFAKHSISLRESAALFAGEDFFNDPLGGFSVCNDNISVVAVKHGGIRRITYKAQRGGDF